MIRYWIYLFNEEVGNEYYPRAEKIVELLREHQYAKATFKNVCDKQVAFITERISFSRIEMGLKENFPGQVEKNLERNMLIFKGEANEEALLIVQKRRLLLVTDNDAIVRPIFHALATISPYFLAVDTQFCHYQWLNFSQSSRKFA